MKSPATITIKSDMLHITMQESDPEPPRGYSYAPLALSHIFPSPVSVSPPMTLASLREDVRFWREEHPAPAPAHYHACPTCYEPEACVYGIAEPRRDLRGRLIHACAIESDLGEHKGCPLGDHAVCSTCRKAGVTE